ncbi:hypothetical protein Ancab_014831 [Ancistrocladus abbreviatus]
MEKQIDAAKTSYSLKQRICQLPSLAVAQIAFREARVDNKRELGERRRRKVVTEITNLVKKDDESSCQFVKEALGLSSSLDGHSLGLNENTPGHEFGNVSMAPNLGEGTTSNILVAYANNDQQIEQHRFELISLLIGYLQAIRLGNIAVINHFTSKLGSFASPRGCSTISHVMVHFTEALALCVIRIWPQIFHITLPCKLDRTDDDMGIEAYKLD